MNITNIYVFFGISAVLFAYLIYTMVRKRKGERPGFEDHDSGL